MFVVLLFVLNAVVLSNCVNEALVGQSVLYGISYLAQEDADFSSACQEELALFYKSVEEQKPWALKGRKFLH